MGQEERAPSTLETRCSSRGSTRTTKNQSSKNKEQRRSDRLLLWNWLQEIRVWHVEYLAPTLTTVTRGDTLVYSRELRLNYIQNEYHILPKNPCFSTFPETGFLHVLTVFVCLKMTTWNAKQRKFEKLVLKNKIVVFIRQTTLLGLQALLRHRT